MRRLIELKFLLFVKFSIWLGVQLDMSVTVTDLPDRVVAKVGQGIIDSTLNADRVVVPFFDVELTGNGEWECFLNGNVCGRLQRSVAVWFLQLTKRDGTPYKIRILEISVP